MYPMVEVDPFHELPISHPVEGFTGVVWPR